MSSSKLKVAFVADPLKNFDPHSETTFFLMHELSARGCDSYHIELKDLFIKDTTPMALVKKVKVTHQKNRFDYTILKSSTENLNQMDAVFLRKDPPVDLSYIDHLSVLELLAEKVLMINHPTSIKHANEKLFALHFKELIPKTFVSQNNTLIRNFVQKEKTAILKPLNLCGGRGIIKVKSSDPSLNSIIDILTENQSRFIMAQEYLPEAKKGDKRILLLDGEILGAFLRIPPKKDFRGNLHSGARLVKCGISNHEKKLVGLIRNKLKSLGLYFVGIDVIGKYVTEINSTSPMGIGELNRNNNLKLERTIINWLEKKTAEFKKKDKFKLS